jgi:two-component system nitrate/nitrite sensor histidine kinase NarX
MITEHFIYHLASLQERERLSRDLHDQLAPGLGFIKIQTAVINEALNRGDLEEARQQLQELKELANDLYTDVREEIFNLRTEISSGREFWPVLEDYLTEYEGRYNLEVELSPSNGARPEFPVKAAGQLLRIIQEALSNVRSHAQASRVTIQVQGGEEQTQITIEDDGQGFDMDQLSENSQSFGLEIMRERAESIGGRLAVDSAPGRGTRLSVSLTRQQATMLQPEL